ncbi:alkaline phosphatase family protein [Azohydromonas caseinilytica]|uniref:Alkaline phosphatase family protein n=1 Tax=Azohydromonas caseinilytica TaxID=2728836 RepID=A0A848FEW3_9BURK|nr:alkaline phosphatase family protein [Azohydromonas caseinilytica]NML17375.1 alkaline phosphatase family protein [Azohydromonas caseinilytica]
MSTTPRPLRNVLFIMADQLRWDYLSCYGHPTLKTPHIDALARRGVRFANAFVQGPVCGASRMSTYTGRYVSTHGSAWNFVPLSVGQKTLGDHVRPHGVRCAVVGKTHVEPDVEGARRLGIDTTQGAGLLAMEGGFEPYERDDGILPAGFKVEGNRYCDYLRAHGYPGDNPWHDWANSGEDDKGHVLSGWEMRWADRPARVAEEHSETPYMTRRAMQFIEEQGDRPWVLHLSYIKPHWPYVAPAPYHAMYSPADVVPARRSQAERDDPHPVVRGYMDTDPSRSFSQPEVRERVIPTYMGLIKQLDDQLGLLFEFLRAKGIDQETLIVFTSDHGDYLGDHWLGEKELFHDAVVKVPLIVVDPRPEADAVRGRVVHELVESIDLIPTFLDALDLPQPTEWLEGASLQPLLHGQGAGPWRDAVFSENSYAFRDPVRLPLGRPVDGCLMTMVRTHRWKYVHYEGVAPQLFDLQADPDEFTDLGQDPAHAQVREQMAGRLFDWLRQRKRFPSITYDDIEQWNRREVQAGIQIGAW